MTYLPISDIGSLSSLLRYVRIHSSGSSAQYSWEDSGSRILRHLLHTVQSEATIITHSDWISKCDQLRLWMKANHLSLDQPLHFLPVGSA